MHQSSSSTSDQTVELVCGDAYVVFTDTMVPVRFEVSGLSMILYPASCFDSGLTCLYLRHRNGEELTVTPLIGPDSVGTTLREGDSVVRRGATGNVAWTVEFTFSPSGHEWRWRIAVENLSPEAVTYDLVATQDFALAPYSSLRNNEYYVSQYLDLSPIFDEEFGNAIAVRQNMPGSRQPWCVLGALGRGAGWATDALQLRTLRYGRAVLDPAELPSRRLQHEHTLAALASTARTVAAGRTDVDGFFGAFVDDHPAASGPADLPTIAGFRADASGRPGSEHLSSPLSAGHSSADARGHLFERPAAPSAPLTDSVAARWFPGNRDMVETGPEGSVWGFRTGTGEHVTARDKEWAVLRPHGQILRTADSLTVDAGILTSTVWMRGLFASQVTVGHVSAGALVSGARTYLGLQDAHGLRVFVRRAGGWELLGIPTAWSVGVDRASWLYDLDGSEVKVTTQAAGDAHQLDFAIRATGQIDQVLVAVHLALGGDDGQAAGRVGIQIDGATLRAEGPGRTLRLAFGDLPLKYGGDELLFDDGESRDLPWVCCMLAAPGEIGFSMSAESSAQNAAPQVSQPGMWEELRNSLGLGGTVRDERVASMDAILPWFTHDAMIHYLTPRGLEQYTGGAWGTRDVCQGPVGLLTAYARDDALRDVLLRIFRDQNERGDWPQAFDFLPVGDEGVRQGEAHGDVVYWPLLALGDYLLSTGDASVLAERVPSRGDGTRTAPTTITEHVHRAISLIASTLVPGTPLPKYGHGDWNDSLQPADPRLAAHMASSWTATLQCHALSRLAKGLNAAGVEPELAERCATLSDATREYLNAVLVVDGVLPGYAVFDDDPACPELLVHPLDRRTGLTFGVLPWVHAISGDQFTPEQARQHLDLIDTHLWGPDGARLFDKPPTYRGGPMEIFQRAEAATFWGREIGLMYTHAHLRYCEALARVGAASRLWDGLLLAVPLGITDRVPVARPRQTTCFYSSSDAAFADRPEAADRYREVLAGSVPLEGGWRVYSSGPGLFLRLVVEDLLGIRRRADLVEVDPVLPPSLDGLEARVPYPGGAIAVRYRVTGAGHGVRAVRVDGEIVDTTPLVNPYRRPGVAIARGAVRPGCRIDVEVGS